MATSPEAPSTEFASLNTAASRSCRSAGSHHVFRFQQWQQFLGRDLFGGFVSGFFKNRVLDDLLGDHLLQFQPVKLEDGDHLDKAGRENLLLCDLEL